MIENLWKHRELLWQFTLRNVELRHKGSHLGLIWSFLNPLLMLGLYLYVFGYIFNGSFGVVEGETRIDFGLGIFFGLTFFHFFSEVLGTAPATIVSNPNFVKKVIFPLQVLPAAGVGSAAIHMLVSLGLALVGVAVSNRGLGVGLLWLPVILLPVLLLGLGAAWFFSALGVFLRDIGQIMQFIVVILMWTSAVFWSAGKFGAAWPVVRFNPLLHAIELARAAVLWHQPINLKHLGFLYLCGIATCYLGYRFFRRMESAFADVL